ATQAADGRGGSTSLLNAALSNWRLKDPKELIGVVGSHRTLAEEIASFAPRVIELAGRNDPSARAIVDDAAADLAVHVNTVVQRLRLEKPALALGGSMIRIAYRNAILSHVKASLGAVTVVQDPTLGALAIARRLLAA